MAETPSCRCRIWRYLGNQAVACVVCGHREPDGIPEGGIMLRHDCEICRRNVLRFTCVDFASVPEKHRGFVDELHSNAVGDLVAAFMSIRDGKEIPDPNCPGMTIVRALTEAEIETICEAALKQAEA